MIKIVIIIMMIIRTMMTITIIIIMILLLLLLLLRYGINKLGQDRREGYVMTQNSNKKLE